MSSRTICVFAESQPREGVKGQERAPMRKRHADVRVDSGAAACSRHPHEPGRTARRALPVPARDCRRRSCFPAVRPADPNRTGTGAGAVRGAGPSRRGIRHLAARFAPQRHSNCVAGRDRGRVDDGGGRVSGMALCRFADRRGDRPGRDRGTTRCGRSQRGHAASAHSAADRARLAGREPAHRRTRVVDLPRCRRRCRGIIQPRRRRPDPVARGGWKPGRRLRAGAAVHGRTPYVRDAAGSTVLQFISTFGVWLLSERLTLSPIITVMVYAMTLAQAASGRLGPRLRITSYAVWETAVFVVNVLAFVLMGLQARPIIERLSPEQRWGSLVFGLTVLALVIVVRIVYLAVYRATVAAIKCWHPSLADRLVSRDPRGTIVISWSGMRGLVTLATAFALPPQFPGRDLIMLCAFCVVLGTLVIQGLTLRPRLRLLRLQDDGAVEREISRARIAVMEAALDSLDGDRSRAATMMREQYAAARKGAEDHYEPQAATKYDELRLRAIAAQREALYHLRAQGEIGDEAFRRIQEELDWSELDAAPAESFQSLTS